MQLGKRDLRVRHPVAAAEDEKCDAHREEGDVAEIEETGEAEDGEANDEGSTGNRFGIPEHLLERSRTARERLGA